MTSVTSEPSRAGRHRRRFPRHEGPEGLDPGMVLERPTADAGRTSTHKHEEIDEPFEQRRLLFFPGIAHAPFPISWRADSVGAENTGRASGTRESVEITFLVIDPGLVRSGTIVEETAAVRFPRRVGANRHDGGKRPLFSIDRESVKAIWVMAGAFTPVLGPAESR